jgi:OTU domain-containing protein 6
MTVSLGEVSSHIVAESVQKLQSFQTQQQAPWLLFGLCICLSAAAGYIAPHLVNSSPPVLAEALVKPSSVIPTTAPTTASSKPTDDEISHGKKVHTEYTITGVPGDGRCLFRAVAHGACLRSGKPAPDESTQRTMADELRNKAIDELVKRRETTEWFIEGDFDTYVKRMRQPHIWGGEPELLMLANVLEMPITVYMKEKGGIIAIAEYGQEYGANNPIQVLYHGFGHYEALQIHDDRPPTSKL